MAVRTSADAPPWEQFDPVIVQEAVADIQLKFRSNFSHPSTHNNVDIRDLDLIQNDPNFVKKFVQQEYFVTTDSKLPDSTQIYEIVLKALEFRHEYRVHDMTVRDIPPLVLRTGFCYTHGMDKQGNTISYLIVRKNKRDAELKKASKLYAVYLVYQQALLCPDQLMTIFIDSTGAGVSNMDLDLIRFLINMFRYYFPLRLGWMLIHNMPWVLTATWNLVKRWLPPKSRDRIVFTSPTDIFIYVSPDQLLSEYGGEVNWRYRYPVPASEADTLLGKMIYLREEDDDNALLSSFEGSLGNGKITAGDLLDGIDESPGFNPLSPLTPTMSEISVIGGISAQRLVELSPRDMLVFSLNNISNRTSCVKISVRNVSPSTVSFKLKATNLTRYKVSPTIGVIEPDCSSSVSISLDLASRLDLALLATNVSKDHFLIMTAVYPVDRPTTPVHILRFWRRLDKQEITNYIFSTRLDSDSAKRLVLDQQDDLDETAELAKLKSKFNYIQSVLSDVVKKQKFLWHILLLLCVQFVINLCLLSWRYYR